MSNSKKIELIPEQPTKSKEFFASTEDYNKFCQKFSEEVEPELERQRKARQQSEADAKQRWMR